LGDLKRGAGYLKAPRFEGCGVKRAVGLKEDEKIFAGG
jgi:hypothetical protein